MHNYKIITYYNIFIFNIMYNIFVFIVNTIYDLKGHVWCDIQILAKTFWTFHCYCPAEVFIENMWQHALKYKNIRVNIWNGS